MHDATKVVRAGLPASEPGSPFRPGPTLAAPYHLPGDPQGLPFTYGRFDNPTWTHFERALAELEGGPAVSFASGMAAVTAVLGVALRPGDVVVLPSDAYYTVRRLVQGYLGEMGVQVRLAPTAGGAQAGALAGAKLLWIESPNNPQLDVCDIAALAAAARAAGVRVAVDNTTATPLAQQPLALGADFSLSSDTKALTGHADLLLGHVAVRDPEWAERLRTWRTQTGAVPGPFEVWLAHRSLATLDVRLERQCANALAIAQLLAERPEVESVRYPGLPGDPAHAVAARQMRHYGCVVSFVLADRGRAERFLSAARLVFEATSFGSVHTTAERRARWGGDAIPEGFIRLSAGCEDARDLVEDIAQALRASDNSTL
jgi:cystathionine gamma-lyase